MKTIILNTNEVFYAISVFISTFSALFPSLRQPKRRDELNKMAFRKEFQTLQLIFGQSAENLAPASNAYMRNHLNNFWKIYLRLADHDLSRWPDPASDNVLLRAIFFRIDIFHKITSYTWTFYFIFCTSLDLSHDRISALFIVVIISGWLIG